jgi:hypothetical protein
VVTQACELGDATLEGVGVATEENCVVDVKAIRPLRQRRALVGLR